VTDPVRPKFGDQHFKTVIALVELQKLRSGAYPEQLKDLQFTGDWDAIAINCWRRPGFEPWRRRGIEPGRSPRARMNASFRPLLVAQWSVGTSRESGSLCRRRQDHSLRRANSDHCGSKVDARMTPRLADEASIETFPHTLGHKRSDDLVYFAAADTRRGSSWKRAAQRDVSKEVRVETTDWKLAVKFVPGRHGRRCSF